MLLQDLLFAHHTVFGDLTLSDGKVGFDAGLFNLACCLDLRCLTFELALGALSGNQRDLCGLAGFNLALLFKPGKLLVALDLQSLLLGIKILALDQDVGFLLDVVALLATLFDFLSEFCEAFRVERVVWIEILLVGLVETGQ